MESRLQEACLNGDVAALRDLLGEDMLVLDRATASASVADGPLHLAALLGHADITMEILTLKPELARDRNSRGSYPLHLASANGHQQVVEVLLKAGADLCHLRDGDGHLPIHIAVLKGRLGITEVLVAANRESARALTTQEESVLHLGVRSNSVEMVELLVDRLELDEDEEFLNVKDERGNTALHLATAWRQAQTLKFLLSKPGVDVNARSERGFTALDVLLERPCDHGDLLLGEIIFSAGGRATGPGSPVLPVNGHGINSPRVVEPERGMNPRRRRPNRSSRKLPDEWANYTPNTIMLVAVLIATVTFQAGIQPPGGFWQDDSPDDNSTIAGFRYTLRPGHHYAGEAVLSNSPGFDVFMFFDTAALFASMSIILLIMCVQPHRRKKLMRFLVWIMWITLYSTMLAFVFGASAGYKYFEKGPYLQAWLAVLGITVLWLLVRLVIYLLVKVLGKKKPENTHVLGTGD